MLHRSRARSSTRNADVALVHVPDGRVDAERAQRAHAADAEHDLLAQAHLAAARRRAMPVIGRSAGSFSGMSVSSISTGTRPTCTFHTAACTTRPGRSIGTVSTPPAGRLHRQHRQPREVVVRVGVLLEAVGVHGLAEVARAVEQADADERARPGRSPPCSGRRRGRRGRPSRCRATRGSRTPSRSTRPGPGMPRRSAGRTSAAGCGTRRGPGSRPRRACANSGSASSRIHCCGSTLISSCTGLW